MNIALFIMIEHFKHYSEDFKVISLVWSGLIDCILKILIIWIDRNSVLIILEILIRTCSVRAIRLLSRS